jgi:glycerophosphoryl diester phosphodiesterase
VILLRVLGHRGARMVAPENTVPSFHAAIAEGAAGVELDIRQTADGALVCLHDAGLGRTTNGRGPVRERTLAEIRQLDAGFWFTCSGSAPYRGCHVRVPTLTEALDALPPDALVDVEVKFRGMGEDGPLRVAELLAEALAGRPDRDRIVVSSFSRRLVAAAVPLLDDLRVGLVTSALVPLGRAVRVAEACGCSVLAAQASAFFGPMARAACARARRAGLLLVAWTVDEPETARRLADLGVEVVVADRPGLLAGELGVRSPREERPR